MTRKDTQDSYYTEAQCSVADFSELIEYGRSNGLSLEYASKIEQHIPIYHCASLQSLLADDQHKRLLMAEWARVFRDGAGIIVLKQAYEDTSIIDKATDVFQTIIIEEKEISAGDHFSAGNNDRVWNAHEKLCLANPELFARYYANEYLDAISEAWLGPNYQVTAQVNQVRPGGKAQQPHRDYHLGFQPAAEAERYPAEVHRFSQYLTLQGAVVHSDMPVHTGPTKLLPFSQKYLPGYVAWRRQDFIDYFEKEYVQLPLSKGDAIYFNPAIFHAAGSNKSKDVLRMANLIQVSSAYAYPMEMLDRVAMCKAIYPQVQSIHKQATMPAIKLDCAIKVCALGYPFPTSLDTDPPLDSLIPQTQADMFRQALEEDWDVATFSQRLDAQQQRRYGIANGSSKK